MLVRLLTHFGYVAIAGLLLSAGVGAPVPEELIQLTAGYLSRRGILAFAPSLAAVYLGIVGGDALLFRLARRHGERLLAHPRMQRVLTPARRDRVERHFARHAVLTVMAARHLPGLRIPIYVLAATHGMRARAFVAADALSALLSVPLVVSLGYLFAAHIENVKRRLHEVELGVLAAALVAAATVVAAKRWRGRAAVTRTAWRAPRP